jgi:dTDP-glucose pyrophosphorylase
MNSWKFDAAIFTACERIEPSARGEYEIPAAVQYAIDHLGTRFHVATYSGGVLDLSHRADIPRVAALLRDVDVNL